MNTNDLSIPASIEPQRHKELLDDIQGNILKGHGKEHVSLLLLHFKHESGRSRARQWIRAFGAGGWATTASAQKRQATNWLGQNIDSLFGNLFLTCTGYRQLGIPDDQIPGDSSFRAGMAGSQEKLNDLPSSKWERILDGQPIHAMVLLAATDEALLEENVEYVKKSLKDIADFELQNGRAIRRESEQEQEQEQDKKHYVGHLNELEGISQPVFFEEEFAAMQGNINYYNPSAPPNLVLFKEPMETASALKGHGSYLVYRKLEQNIQGIKKRESDFTQNNKSNGDDTPPLVARALGRFDFGRPLSLPKLEQNVPIDERNDFNYQDDPEGVKCPLNAHIRKINPRTDESRPRRIVRRSVTYDNDATRSGPAAKSAQTHDALPTDGVGVLFMCFQSSITDQFEFLQKQANNPDQPIKGTGRDALIGQPPPKDTDGTKTDAADAADADNSFNRFVTLKGGEYFFAPSMTFFESLRNEQAVAALS